MNVFVILSSEREFEGLPVRELIAKLEQIGVSASASRKVINDLIDFRYLFTRSHQSVTDDSILFASRFCGYIVRELIGRLMFIETLMFDTFISDDSVWEKIKRNVASIYRDRDPRRRFNTRKEAARQFFNFCESKTETLVENARRAGLPRPWHTNPLTKIKQAFRNDLFRATRSAKRVFKPQNGWRANGGR